MAAQQLAALHAKRICEQPQRVWSPKIVGDSGVTLAQVTQEAGMLRQVEFVDIIGSLLRGNLALIRDILKRLRSGLRLAVINAGSCQVFNIMKKYGFRADGRAKCDTKPIG